jgi:hypothetical protein
MRSVFSFCLLLMTLTGLEPASSAGTAPGVPGLQMSLTTSAAKVEAPDAPAAETASKRPFQSLPKDSVTASVALTNLSRSAVLLSYPGEVDDGPFKFSLLNSSGAVVWMSINAAASDEAGEDDAPKTDTLILAPRATLRRTLKVPLKTEEGEWLPLGRYTLRAETGFGEALAQVPIDLANTTPPPGTGIQGQVFFRELSATGNPGDSVDPIPTRAIVSISEIRLPNARYAFPAFEWTGPTDNEGRFKVATPPGRFHLIAHSKNIIEPNYFAPNHVEVTVNKGQFTTQDFTILGTLRKQKVLVASVASVTVELVGEPVHSLRITAKGQTNTGGWTQPQLVRKPSVSAGVLSLDFVAFPPDGPATQAFAPIEAQTVIPYSAEWKSVRVRASGGSVSADIKADAE